MTNGAAIYGSATTTATMATIKVNGGTLTLNDASVYNVQQTGTAIHLENTAGSSLNNIDVRGAHTGIRIKNAAPTIDDFTLTDNTIGFEIDGGMTLPTIFRSTLLSGQSRGWTTYDMDITNLASDYNYIQYGFNSVYNGGNAHPMYNYATSKYYAVYDRMRIAINDGIDDDSNSVGDELENFTLDTAGTQMTGYYASPELAGGDYSNYGDRNSPNHPTRNDGWARYDCNNYGYQYNPGGSYQYGYYWYFLNNYGPYTSSGAYYGANAYPGDFGFTLDKVDGLTGGQNYYPYNYWGYYWPSFYFGSGSYGGVFTPPEGFNGMWGNYNVCLNYAYTYQTPAPNGYRVSWPIVDTSSSSITDVHAFIDIVHNGADYFQDKYEFVFRGGNSIQELMDARWGREFGTSSITNGQIDGSTTGIEISGNYGAANFGQVTVNDPINEGILISGSVATDFDDVTIDGGRYGLRMTQSASGAMDLTNVVFDSQTQDGLVLSKDFNLGFGGTISNAVGSGVRIVSGSTGDWEFNGLTLTDNGVGLATAGAGQVLCTDCTFSNNGDDVSITGSSMVTALEGIVDGNAIDVTGSGIFQRARRLQIDLAADGNAIAGTPIVILDANNHKADQGVTGTGVDAGTLMSQFFTYTVDSGGTTTMNLNGYKAVTAALVEYSSSVADFRWAKQSLTLTDAPGNQETVDLTNNFDARVCYSFASATYNVLQACSGTHYLATGSSRTKFQRSGGTATIEEYGYYNALPTNMENKNILIDSPWTYLSASDTSFNGSTMFTTGFYSNSWSDMYAGYPYGGDAYFDDVEWTAVGSKGTELFNIGYYGGYNYGNFYVNNSLLVNIGSIGSGASYYVEEPVIRVTNSTLIHYWAHENPNGVYQEEICISSAGNYIGDDGISNYLIQGNDLWGCTVGFMVYSNYYAYNAYYNGNGTDGAVWSDNTLEDSTYLAFWMYLNAHCEDHTIDNNTVSGSLRLQYGAYTQDQTCPSLDITNNDISADNPIYLRGQGAGVGTEYNIDGNTIRGIKSAANAGIYLRNGWGSVSDNTLLDADGGINVYGVLSGHDIHLDRNSISATGGRINPTALGIVLENCGLRTIHMNGNDVVTTANALVSEGCNIVDTGSSFTATGGSAAAVTTVDIMASYFSPQTVTIDTGGTIRWRAVQYNSDPNNYIHTTTSDDGLWDSGQMNLGSTFVYTFTTAGTYNYTCSSHSTMTGTITVVNATAGGSNLRTTGITALDGNERFTFNGTAISGFSTGIDMDGGYLTMKGNAVISADWVGVDASNVNIVIDGATINTNSGYGVSLSSLSSTTRHTLDVADLSTSGAIGLLTTAHGDFRWNGGTSTSATTLKTIYGAQGSIENMTWDDTTTQIDVGAYSVVTSVGNTLNASKLAMTTTSLIHEGNLLDMTVTHMGSPTTNVGVMIKSQMQGPYVDFSRSEYTSPSMRGNTITVDGTLGDWEGAYVENDADDAQPGVMAFTQTAAMMITWDTSNLYIALRGATFTLLDGMIYLDTRPGGSTTSDDSWMWAPGGASTGGTHTLPFLADYLIFAEDTGDWGIKQLTTGNTWTDITTTLPCAGIGFYVGWGIPGMTAFNVDSEFAIPWSCLGSPQGMIRWLALLHADPIYTTAPGLLVGIFPLQQVNLTCHCAQVFYDYGTLNVDPNNADLPDGQLDDFLLIRRTWYNLGGTISSTPDRTYQVMVKVKDVERVYWDWGVYNALAMDQNRVISIDILRAKPVIQNLVDVEYDEDTGAHTISLTDKAQDYQDASSALTWTVQN
ncbi:MAG: hypothetical protein CXX72_02240, partial [Methanobacteriota archaeon]